LWLIHGSDLGEHGGRAGLCPASPPTEAGPGLPPDVTFVRTRQGDIDGDGVPDLLALYVNGPLFHPSTQWTLRVALATGETIDKTLVPGQNSVCINLPRCEFQSLYCGPASTTTLAAGVSPPTYLVGGHCP